MSALPDFAMRRVRLVDPVPSAEGLSVDADGLYLGACALIGKRAGRFGPRGPAALDYLLTLAYGGGDARALHDALWPIARKIDEDDLPGTMIRALLLGLPDLPDEAARLRLESADDLFKLGFDPDEPRDEQGRWSDAGTSAAILRDAFEAAGRRPRTGGVQVADASGQTPLVGSMGPWPRLLAVGDEVRGKATYYGNRDPAAGIVDQFAGERMANGKIMDPTAMIAAVRPNNIPIGATVSVTRDDDPSQSITVPVTDNGMINRTASSTAGSWVPWAGTEDHVIDLSPAAYRALMGTLKANPPSVTVRILSVPTGHYYYSPNHQ